MIPSNTIHTIFSQRGTSEYSLNSIATITSDPEHPSKAPTITTTNHTLLAFPGSINKRNKMFTVVIEGDLALWVDTTDLTVIPTTNDTVVHPTEGTYTINQIRKFKDKGSTYLYVLQLRQ